MFSSCYKSIYLVTYAQHSSSHVVHLALLPACAGFPQEELLLPFCTVLVQTWKGQDRYDIGQAQMGLLSIYRYQALLLQDRSTKLVHTSRYCARNLETLALSVNWENDSACMNSLIDAIHCGTLPQQHPPHSIVLRSTASLHEPPR